MRFVNALHFCAHMKKIVLAIVFVVACIVIGSIAGVATFHKATLTPLPDLPQRIVIPSLNVDSTIEQVGLDSQKRMDVPKNVFDVGWYDLGVRPGQIGSAVIDGHFDTPTGAPSVFY